MDVALLSLLIQYSNYYGIDPQLSLAVAKVESSLNPKAIGPLGEIGLFQLRPEYFKKYTINQLFDPRINIKLGIKHIYEKKKICKHQDNYSYILCYNLGEGGASRVKHPKKFPYYKKIMQTLETLKRGDKVIVKDLYNNRVDGECDYIGLCKEKYYENYVKVLNEYGTIMYIEKERISFLPKGK